jgi:hypothetical protein
MRRDAGTNETADYTLMRRHRISRLRIAHHAPRSPNTALPVPSPRTASVPARAARSTPPFSRFASRPGSSSPSALSSATCCGVFSVKPAICFSTFARRGASRSSGSKPSGPGPGRHDGDGAVPGRVGREPATARVPSGTEIRRRHQRPRGRNVPERDPGDRRGPRAPPACAKSVFCCDARPRRPRGARSRRVSWCARGVTEVG